MVRPWCGDEFPCDLFISSCEEMSQEILDFSEEVDPNGVGELEWMESHFDAQFGKRIWSVVCLLKPVRVSQE